MSRYLYSHPDGHGVGRHHAGRELSAEMRDLDLSHGTEVERVATDEDTAALILAWKDRTGVARNSAVSPEFFAAHFTALDAAEGA